MVNTLFKDVGMTDESEDEDEVVTKKKVSKATPKKAKKKASKETKKKVSKKIIKKKAPQKKKSLAVKGDIKTAKEISKNVQVGSFLKTPVKPIETGEELCCIVGDPNCSCLDPAVKTYPSFIKNFHGSIHINCRYTKIFSNQS